MPCAMPLMVGTHRRHLPPVGQACWGSLLGAGMSDPEKHNVVVVPREWWVPHNALPCPHVEAEA